MAAMRLSVKGTVRQAVEAAQGRGLEVISFQGGERISAVYVRDTPEAREVVVEWFLSDISVRPAPVGSLLLY